MSAPMKFFRETEPSIFIATGQLVSEQDGKDWVAEYDQLLARDLPLVVIAHVEDQPQPGAGKPMILWIKARKADLSRLVKRTIYVVEDDTQRAEMQRLLPGRAKASPYPMALAASEAEAIRLARESF
ncbi:MULTISPECIES: hypothetical protein [unclassified Beijerinckia]|uniref:hypothetical protein n=1 Tax=unclassified Beijerinckia TaxID=2638183 RepID=UPI00089CF074|nr:MULTISPECIES: hypothetical protein [unclassified Beijerinckia]MDH7796151.1 hypothetical protein [Beijerinckia sp. GAS462]SEC32606.1 hypothetical protein SAMN05443249_2433 [Beijerinckia sp. 28-YEA-48]